MISKNDAAFSEPIYAPERLCLWAAGVSPRIVTFLPNERHLYVSVGAGVILTSIMAAMSGFFCFRLVLAGEVGGEVDVKQVVPLALFWALLIGNLDRSIVCNTPPWSSPGGGLGKFLLLVSRLALAILIAFVVSIPLELQLFKKRVDQEIVAIEGAKLQTQVDQAKQRLLDAQRARDRALGNTGDPSKALVGVQSPADGAIPSVQPSVPPPIPDLPEAKTVADIQASIETEQTRNEELKRRRDGSAADVQRFVNPSGSLRQGYTAARERARIDDQAYNKSNTILENLMADRKIAQDALIAAQKEANELTNGKAKRLEAERVSRSTVVDDRRVENLKVKECENDYQALEEKKRVPLKPDGYRDLLSQINALENINELPVQLSKWLVRALIALVEIIPVFLKLSSRVKHYDELTDQISEANKNLCVNMVDQQSEATKTAYTASNSLRTKTVTANEKEIVEAATEMIKAEVRKWKEAKAPRARDFWHNLRVITDQLFPGRIADYNKGTEAQQEGDPPKTAFAALTPTNSLVLSLIVLLSGLLSHSAIDQGAIKLPPEVFIVGAGIVIGCLFDYMKTAGRKLARYQSNRTGLPAEDKQATEPGVRGMGQAIWVSVLVALLIATSLHVPKTVVPEAYAKSKSATGTPAESEKKGNLLDLDGFQMLSLVMAAVVAMLSQIAKQEDP